MSIKVLLIEDDEVRDQIKDMVKGQVKSCVRDEVKKEVKALAVKVVKQHISEATVLGIVRKDIKLNYTHRNAFDSIINDLIQGKYEKLIADRLKNIDFDAMIDTMIERIAQKKYQLLMAKIAKEKRSRKD